MPLAMIRHGPQHFELHCYSLCIGREILHHLLPVIQPQTQSWRNGVCFGWQTPPNYQGKGEERAPKSWWAC